MVVQIYWISWFYFLSYGKGTLSKIYVYTSREYECLKNSKLFLRGNVLSVPSNIVRSKAFGFPDK